MYLCPRAGLIRHAGSNSRVARDRGGGASTDRILGIAQAGVSRAELTHLHHTHLNYSPRHPSDPVEATQMMPDQLARQEQIALRLEQSKRLLRGTHDPTTTERIGKLSVTSSMSKWKKKRSK